MKYLIIAFCIFIIVLSFVILIRYLKSSFKNKCCGNCYCCKVKNCDKRESEDKLSEK